MKRPTYAALAAAAVIFAVATTQAATIVGVTETNTIVTFDSSAPLTLTSGKPIAGLAVNEDVRGIDFRPTTGLLYALGSFGNVYTIDTSTIGAATASLQFNVNDDPDLIAAGGLDGAAFGFDFNPQADAAGANSLRIVSDTAQNLAVNADTGDVFVATDVFYPVNGPARIAGEAYTNSVPGGTTAANPTAQYAIDTGTDMLVLQAFNAGTLTNVGPLGVDANADVGFDIFSPALGSNIGFATLDPEGNDTSNFYIVDLMTGAANNIGEINGGILVTAIAAVPIPEPSTLAFVACGVLTLFYRRF